MLEFRNLTISQGTFALDVDDMTVEPGLTAIMGPSGAGKSTIVSAVGGFLPVPPHSILWRGADITALSPSKRPSAVVFQDNNLFPHLSLFRNVALALSTKSRLSSDQHDRILSAMAKVGLTGLEDRRPADVSGGQQSRAALARVLLQDKPVLLLDEPFSALGPALKDEMLDLLAQIARDHGTSVIMVTHDPQDAKRIADQVIVVDHHRAAAPISISAALAKGGPLDGYLSH